MAVAIARDNKIPAGRFRSGSLTSSPIAATLVTPAYATKTKAAVSASVHISVEKAPSRGTDASKSAENRAMMHIRMSKMTVTATIGVCTAFTFETPRMFTSVMRTRADNEMVYMLNSMSKYVVTTAKYAEKPISAKADLSKNDDQRPSPLTVPIRGPYVRSKKT